MLTAIITWGWRTGIEITWICYKLQTFIAQRRLSNYKVSRYNLSPSSVSASKVKILLHVKRNGKRYQYRKRWDIIAHCCYVNASRNYGIMHSSRFYKSRIHQATWIFLRGIQAYNVTRTRDVTFYIEWRMDRLYGQSYVIIRLYCITNWNSTKYVPKYRI